ncbi:glycosyltransferase [Isobaculum melis]|nr:glycosyltransferase [Isobaculum melis]
MAVVVTYEPDANVYENIKLLSQQLPFVLVVDNTPNQQTVSFTEKQIEVVDNGGNKGIAQPLNLGLEKALALGYDGLFTFDQDSRVTENYIQQMVHTFEAYEKEMGVAPALVSPTYQHPDEGMTYDLSQTKQTGYTAIETAMTSGNLLNVPLITSKGIRFREDYFIDCVDHEFCFHLKKENLVLIQSFDSLLLHTLGEVTSHRFLGKTMVTTNHNAIRRYFITRNRIAMYKAYWKGQKRWIRTDWINSWVEFIKIVLFEKNKLKKIQNVCRGIKDGLFNKMGPYPYDK